MDDHISFIHQRENSARGDNDAVDPPRTRIAIACNRCRRRKIKCSGSVEGGSCDGCIRASDAECVFADRPRSRKGSGTDSPTASPLSTSSASVLQPPGPMRSTSLPTSQRLVGTVTSSPQVSAYRSLSSASITSPGSFKTSSPPRRSSTRSPSQTMSSPTRGMAKRPSMTHPYQRPNSSAETQRPSSSDQVASNLVRYSQSLVQAQTQQLTGHPGHYHQQQQQQQQEQIQQQYRSASIPGPRSVPLRYTPQQVSMPQHALLYSMPSSAPSMPTFRQPDYNDMTSYAFADYGATAPEFTGVSYGQAGTYTPDSSCQSPVFQSSMYSVSTPEMVSSDSVSTIATHTSTMTFNTLEQLSSGPPSSSQRPFMHLDYSNLQAMPIMDPSKWTPGLDPDKFANQWLQFSPQQHDGMSSNAYDQRI